MLKSQNKYNIKQLSSGMLVANIDMFHWFFCYCAHKQDPFKYVFTGYKGSRIQGFK